MRKLFIVLIAALMLLGACGPAVLPESTPLASSPSSNSPEAVSSLELLPLNDPAMQSEFEQLVTATESRTSEDIQILQEWFTQPVVRWNEEAQYWVIYHALEPVIASRVYALMSVSQQRALDEFEKLKINAADRRPDFLDEDILPMEPGCEPLECAVLIGASEPILLYLFPDYQEDITGRIIGVRNALLSTGTIFPSDLDAAEEFGRVIATDLIAERRDDGTADAKKFDSLPEGEGVWKLDPFRARPEMPGWSKVTPWFLSSPDQFRAPPPPEFGSPEFEAALAEVRQTVLTNTQREKDIASFWGDKRGSYTPPGHWNAITVNLIKQKQISERDASHIFAALNMSMMDAGIACWDSKFFYYMIRPWQADPTIPTLIGYPNHPSYPSGHSCFSGAAAEILSYFFPEERENLWAMAEEASISRLYGGVHYRFDLIAGKEMGRQVALLAISILKPLNWELTK